MGVSLLLPAAAAPLDDFPELDFDETNVDAIEEISF